MKSLEGSLLPFIQPQGQNFTSRLTVFKDWVENRINDSYYQYGRTLLSPPLPNAEVSDLSGNRYTGINLAVQDYLSLATHPSMFEAIKDSITKHGVHSAGSPAYMGNNELSNKLEAKLADMLKMKHVLLFPTGWAAGFGIVSGLVRKGDFIVMDQLSHACLQSGAQQTGATTLKFAHNSVDSLRDRLKEIRLSAPDAAILVVTESLFSMDSDSPDIAAMQKVTHEFGGVMVVDVAHCLGNCGPQGTGILGIQDVLGKVDLVIGSFSKTFASIGGFVALNDDELKHYLQWFASSWTFSNAQTPVQTAVILNSLRIIKSDEGQQLRDRLHRAVVTLRDGLASHGFNVIGTPSAIVPVVIGHTALLRITSRLLTESGVLANMSEFPIVPKDKGRLRLQVMASHSEEDMRKAADRIAASVEKAKQLSTELGLIQ